MFLVTYVKVHRGAIVRRQTPAASERDVAQIVNKLRIEKAKQVQIWKPA